MTRAICQTLLSATAIGTFLLTANAALARLIPLEAEIPTNDNLISVDFSLPDDKVPQSAVVGGGVRGNVQFALPGGAAPRSGVAGGTRGDVQFALPGGAAPRSGVAGGTRGDVQLTLPGGAAPRSGVAGGSRGDVQLTLPADGKNPYTSVDGDIRGDVELLLPSEDSVPSTALDATTTKNSVSDIPVLTAIVPPTKYGRTVSPRPTIYVYLPPIGAREVFFSIQDEAGNPHYHTILNVSPQGGVMAITLPPDTPELEIDKNYLWYFAPIEPGGILRPDNYAVTGWVKRVKNTVNKQEFADSPVKLATKYAEAGIWYDTLQVLVEALRSEPTNKTYSQEWHDLLEQVNLGAIASQPFVF